MVTWRCTATALAVLCGAGLACSPGAERPAAITSVSPLTAYNDVEFLLQINGGDFRPAYEFDTMSAAASVQEAFSGVLAPSDAAAGGIPVAIDPVSWEGTHKLRATVPAGLAAGTYDVAITDPRGDVYPMAGGFTSLGPDVHAPVIVVTTPANDTIVGAGTEVTVMLSADDGEGWLTVLTWSVTWAAGTLIDGTCAVGAGAKHTPCSFDFTAPAPAAGPEPLLVQLSAFDSKLNIGSVTIPLLLAPRPTLTGLSPSVGPADMPTQLTITGSDFVAGSVVVVDGQDLPTEFKSDTQLLARTLPHDPGPGLVSVRTGGAVSMPLTFGFFPKPIIKAIDPAHGPEGGGNLVIIVGRYFRAETEIWFQAGVGQAARLSPSYFKSANRIEGFAPIAPAGVATVKVLAYDRIGGVGELLGAYVYESSNP